MNFWKTAAENLQKNKAIKKYYPLLKPMTKTLAREGSDRWVVTRAIGLRKTGKRGTMAPSCRYAHYPHQNKNTLATQRQSLQRPERDTAAHTRKLYSCNYFQGS